MNDMAKILQIRAGRVAALMPAEISGELNDAAAAALIHQAVEVARQGGVLIVQSLLHPADERAVGWLKSCGFSYLTDVLHLVCPRESFPATIDATDLQFMAFDESPEMRKRLPQLILRTYEGSQDCPQLNGLRAIDDVLANYQAVGEYNPQRWFMVRRENADVGCLLLAEHPQENDWEIVYLGVTPQFRRRGLGLQFVRQAQFLAAQSAAEQLSLAVDAVNRPALAIYRASGFTERAKHRLFMRRI
jgi:mycothiol synthase